MSEADRTDVARMLAEAERHAEKHFDEVRRAIAQEDLVQLLSNVPSVPEQLREAKRS